MGTKRHLVAFDKATVATVESAILALVVQYGKGLQGESNPKGLTQWGLDECAKRLTLAAKHFPSLMTEFAFTPNTEPVSSLWVNTSATRQVKVPAAAQSASNATPLVGGSTMTPAEMLVKSFWDQGKKVKATRTSRKKVAGSKIRVDLTPAQKAAQAKYFKQAGGDTPAYDKAEYRRLLDTHKVKGKLAPIPHGAALWAKPTGPKVSK